MSKLSNTEELDFCYLLALLPALKEVPGYTALPELFSIVGHKALIDLCKYAGGETLQIPTLEELNDSIEALRWYYYVFVEHRYSETDIPAEYYEEAMKIVNHTKVGN